MDKKLDVVALKVAELLDELGMDLESEDFGDTPKRFAQYLMSRCVSREDIEKETRSFARATFKASYRQMVILEGIEVSSLCPHHLLPVLYNVNIGYVPDKRVVGLSKLTRFAKVCALRPQLQESYTDFLADTIEDTLKCLGVIVTVRGEHFCMKVRGVEQTNSSAVTSAIRGIYATQKELNTRMEFFELIHHPKQ